MSYRSTLKSFAAEQEAQNASIQALNTRVQSLEDETIIEDEPAQPQWAWFEFVLGVLFGGLPWLVTPLVWKVLF